jgi:excisionase family DNA binding protein
MNSGIAELVSIKTLCHMLDVPEKTVRTWVYRRAIPYHKLGKLVRFRVDEVRRWYAAGRVESLTEPILKSKIH